MDAFLFLGGLLEAYGLLGLAAIAFLSVSLLPWPSEPFIVLAAAHYPVWQVFLVVTVASLASSTVNYLVGLKGLRTWLVKRDPKEEKKAEKWICKWGSYALLFSPWVPFVGDLFPVAAGTAKMGWLDFFAFTLLGRIVKTAAVIGLGAALLSLL
jgi:membrane protein YqaA with SNARE-associated domain